MLRRYRSVQPLGREIRERLARRAGRAGRADRAVRAGRARLGLRHPEEPVAAVDRADVITTGRHHADEKMYRAKRAAATPGRG